MAGSDSQLAPEPLRQQVLADWAPVAPLASPWRRVAALAPMAAVMAVVAAFYWGMPHEADRGGQVAMWALSALQWTAGLWLLSLAFREAVPGRGLDRAALLTAVGLTLLVLALNLGAKDALRGTVVPAGREWRFWTACIEGPLLLGAPLLVFASLLVSRAFPVRPVMAGALSGLAAAVVTDAGWRLGCFVSSPGHVIGAHWLAVAATTAVGAVVGRVADARRWRR